MAIAGVEKLRNTTINVKPLLEKVVEFVDLNKRDRIIASTPIWDLGIPSSTIYKTTGRCLMYQEALNCSISPELNSGVAWWRNQRRKELLDYLNKTPQSRDIYKSLRKSGIVTFDIKETFGEKCQRLLANITKGRERLMKVTVDKIVKSL